MLALKTEKEVKKLLKDKRDHEFLEMVKEQDPYALLIYMQGYDEPVLISSEFHDDWELGFRDVYEFLDWRQDEVGISQLLDELDFEYVSELIETVKDPHADLDELVMFAYDGDYVMRAVS